MALHSIFMPMEVLLIPQVEICDFHNLTAEYQIALIYAKSQKIPVELGSEKTVEVNLAKKERLHWFGVIGLRPVMATDVCSCSILRITL